MLSTNILGSIAISLGIAALLTCFIGVPLLYQKCDSLKFDLETGIGEFKGISDRTWTRLMNVRGAEKTASRLGRQPKKRLCQCSDENPCPPGAPGRRGRPGMDGLDGPQGDKGTLGSPGPYPRHIPSYPSIVGACRSCALGAKGPPGPPGPPGKAGSKGPKGKRPTVDQLVGPPGPPGPSGAKGRTGPKGFPGADHYGGYSKGPPGAPGESGIPGSPGLNGARGADGRNGGSGWPGPMGPSGRPGADGARGTSQGEPGDAGIPGRDAHYCPCPRPPSWYNTPGNDQSTTTTTEFVPQYTLIKNTRAPPTPPPTIPAQPPPVPNIYGPAVPSGYNANQHPIQPANTYSVPSPWPGANGNTPNPAVVPSAVYSSVSNPNPYAPYSDGSSYGSSANSYPAASANQPSNQPIAAGQRSSAIDSLPHAQSFLVRNANLLVSQSSSAIRSCVSLWIFLVCLLSLSFRVHFS